MGKVSNRTGDIRFEFIRSDGISLIQFLIALTDIDVGCVCVCAL